jgi:hypothetical protein
LDIADIADVSADILRHWSKKTKLSLPSISELPGPLDKPLPHDEKIPLTRIQFDNLLSGLTETKDFCYRDDVERLFRISDAEASEILHLISCLCPLGRVFGTAATPVLHKMDWTMAF